MGCVDSCEFGFLFLSLGLGLGFACWEVWIWMGVGKWEGYREGRKGAQSWGLGIMGLVRDTELRKPANFCG